MSTPPDISPGQLSLAQARAALAHSKHGLLTWADATDARTRAARATVARTAARGIIASLGGLLAFKLFRSLRPGRPKPAIHRSTAAPSAPPSSAPSAARGINWTSAARVGIWAFPHALRLWQHHTQPPPAAPPPTPKPPHA
jgi:hypothetical protein